MPYSLLNSRFSLRTLALLVTCIACAIVPIAYQVRASSRHRIAVGKLREMGATVWFEQPSFTKGLKSAKPSILKQRWRGVVEAALGEDFFQRAEMVSFVEYEGETSNLEPLLALESVRELSYVHASVNPELVDLIMKMPNLEKLNLSDTDVDDRSLAKLVTKQSLSYVNIMGSKATPEAVQAFCDARPDCKLSVALDGEFMAWLNRLVEEGQ